MSNTLQAPVTPAPGLWHLLLTFPGPPHSHPCILTHTDETDWWLRTLVLAEDLGSIPSSHTVGGTILNCSPRGSDGVF